MNGSSPSRLALLLVAALLAVGLPLTVAYHNETLDSHLIDLSIEDVSIYETGGFDPDDPDQNRVDFLEVGENFDVTVRIAVGNDTTSSDCTNEGDCPRNVSVHLEATHEGGGSASIEGKNCWNVEEPPDADEWVFTSSEGINVVGEGDVTLTAWVNTNETESSCKPKGGYDEWDESGGKDDNVGNRTAYAGAAPDLAVPDPVRWCWNEEAPPNASGEGGAVCPDGLAVNLSNTDAVYPRQSGNTTETYFRVDLANVGNYTLTSASDIEASRWPPGEGNGSGSPDGTGTIVGIRNPDDPAASLEHGINVTIRHKEFPDQRWWPSRTGFDAVDYLGNTSSLVFDLAGKPGGEYRITWRLDRQPHDRIAELDEGNNKRTLDFKLHAPDLEPEINRSEIRTSPDNPYEYDGEGTIHLNVTLRNVGARNVTHDWAWRAELHPETEDRRSHLTEPGDEGRVFTGNLSAGDEAYAPLEITYCLPDSEQEKDCELAPGNHTLQVRLDTNGDVTEELEGNNIDEVTFYTNDDDPPVVEDLRRDPSGDTVRAGEDVTFEVHLREDDPDLSDVTLHLERDGNVTTYNMSKVAEASDVPHFNFTATVENLLEEGTYSWWVSGSDPSGNAFGTGNAPLVFEVDEWPKNIEIHTPVEGQTYDWAADWSTVIRFSATINQTGSDPVWDTSDKYLNFTTPGGQTSSIEVKSNWTDSDGCPPGGDEQASETDDCKKDRFFREIHFDQDQDPGVWNFTFAVEDAAGVWAEEHSWFKLQDSPPTVHADRTVVDPESGEVDSESEVGFATNVTDPDGHIYMPRGEERGDVGVQEVHVNFTHKTSGRSANVSLDLLQGNSTESTWVRSVETGRDGALRWAGQYDYTIHARDWPGNWALLPAEDPGLETPTVNVFDTRGPEIADADVEPSAEETDVPVRFWAEVDDDTALDVRVSIDPPEDSDLCPEGQTTCSFPLERVGETDLYELQRSFSVAGSYNWEIIVTDSAGNSASTSVGTLDISKNLAPTVIVTFPTEPVQGVEGTYWIDPTPVFSADVQDPKDVDEDSISLTVDGETVNETLFDLSRIEPQEFQKPGYALTFEEFRTKYEHGNDIQIRVEATDKSDEEKTRTAFRTLVVDGNPPTASLDKWQPRYRVGGAIWNVSPHTEFVLSGDDDPDDDDESASGVKDVKFTLDEVAKSDVHTYDGPFKFNGSTFPELVSPDTGQLTGDTIYKFAYWAEDRAGNAGPENTVFVRLDTKGPTIKLFEDSKFFPQGRFINLSISDPQGVADATLHYRDPDTGEWQAQTMERSEGLYRGVLPDVPRGQRVDFYLSARDQLLNEETQGTRSNPHIFEAGNHAPDVSFISPQNGNTLTGETTFRWEASDPDPGDDISFTLEYKLAAEDPDSYVQVTPLGPGDRQVQVDTTQFPDATYDFRIAASDGISASVDEVRVRLDNAEEAAAPGELSSEEFRLGDTVKFTSEVRTAAEKVELVITRDGEEVGRFAMNDRGLGPDAQANDNIYTTEATFNESGTYGWWVEVTFEEAGQVTTERSDKGQTFRVEASASQVIERNLGLWIAVAVLTASAVGIGWYALRNHQTGP